MATNNFKEIAKKTHEKFSLLNATNVFPGLYIGSMYAATDEEFLKNNNIKYILNVTESSQDKVSDNNNINCLNVPMRDEINFNAIKHFQKTCEFIDSALKSRFEQAKNEIINKESTLDCLSLEKHDNILVHCQLGISRSATIVSAYLLYKYYEYNSQNENDIDNRTLLQYLLENESLKEYENSENGKSTKISSTVNVPFDCVSSVLKYLQRKRPTIKPNEGFQRQLQLWQSKLKYNYDKEKEKALKDKIKNDKDYKSTPSSPSFSKNKKDHRLSNSLEYLKIYSISKCNDIKYKYLSKKKSMSETDIGTNSSSKISKEEVAKKLNL